MEFFFYEYKEKQKVKKKNGEFEQKINKLFVKVFLIKLALNFRIQKNKIGEFRKISTYFIGDQISSTR